MEAKSEHPGKNNHGNMAGKIETPLKTGKEKDGWLKRLLRWIARGAERANIGKGSCTT